MPNPVRHRWPINGTWSLAFLAVVALASAVACAPPPAPTPMPTLTPEPIVPTRTPTAAPVELPPTATAAPTALPPTATAVPAQREPQPQPSATPAAATVGPPAATVALPRGRERFGVGVATGGLTGFPMEQLGIGWYLDWWVRENPARPAGIDFWQMVRVSEEGYRPPADAIRRAAAANPGSFWLIGNEPDVRWQDNTTPERYAELYHELYHLLKDADATAQVVIAGVSQPTPLRLAYLERVLDSYRQRYGQPMPVDVWNVHGFILREERDSWGVDIPPGMAVDTGMLYEIDDHDDLEIFGRQILEFRRWMARHGQREKPLVVSEYGILMPADYGFGHDELRAFLEGSFDFFLTATDGEVGYPRDGNRLVQWWCWYSLAAPEDYYPTGNLFDPATREMTPLGEAFAGYAGP